MTSFRPGSPPGTSGHPYQRFVAELTTLHRQAQTLPLGGFGQAARPTLGAGAPTVLLLSPHPDDECLTAGLPLRLLRQAGMRVVTVPVTLGSDLARRPGRLVELHAACAFLGFQVAMVAPAGLERVRPATRNQDPPLWQASVQAVADLIAREQPAMVFFPHSGDWNITHLGTHQLALEALHAQPPGFSCGVVETEYWATMPAPNLLVESTPEEVGDLVAAVSFHAEEVRRNPYHLRLPAWLQDNVRRGGEVVAGQGASVPDYDFATLYRLGQWRGGRLEPLAGPGRLLGKDEDPAALLQV
jgi:LmbE family N-acetylglucosaminyl deacetylase